MKKKNVHLSNKGQSLVLVALMLFALIGILALILDGGNAYLKRRQAQSAADAGALAGVRELCLGTPALANSVAIEYAENRNYENQPDAEIDAIPTVLNSSRMRVEANVTYDTFFASILGVDRPTVWAIAEAACFSASYGDGVLPIVWACREPVEGWPSGSVTCQQQRIKWDTLMDDYFPFDETHPELYIVMDNLKTDDTPDGYDPELRCIQDPDLDPPGTLDCDFDGDGESDWVSRGGSSWIDLDGGDNMLWQDGILMDPDYDCGSGGKDELKEWIETGFPCEFFDHIWVPDEETVGAGSLYLAALDRWENGNPLILIPVAAEELCQMDPSAPDATCDTHPLDYVVSSSNDKQGYYHIDTFAAFYITCVRIPGQNPSCPGSDIVMDANDSIGSEFKSIEGYFLEGEFDDIGGRGDPDIDTGLVTIFLDR